MPVFFLAGIHKDTRPLSAFFNKKGASVCGLSTQSADSLEFSIAGLGAPEEVTVVVAPEEVANESDSN